VTKASAVATDDAVDTDKMVEVDTAEGGPAAGAPRRARSPFAPPTPAAGEDDLADDDVDDESIAREPVLPVPVFPSPGASARDMDSEPEVESEPAPEPASALEPAFAHSPSINDLAHEQFADDESLLSRDLPPRRQSLQGRGRATAESRERYPSYASVATSQEYTEESIPSFHTSDGAPSRRRIDVPLVVTIGLSTAGVVLIVYLAILVFGARG
jgi:hypothetical protein